MVKLPKAIIKKYGITKKAWSVFRGKKKSGGSRKRKSAKRKRTRARVTHRRRAPVPAVAANKSGKPARRKRGKMARRVRRHGRRAVARIRAGMDTRPGKVLMMAGQVAVGGAGTSFILNKTPKVKDLPQGGKAALQAGVGVAAIFLGKKRWIKGLGAGAVVAGLLSGVKALLKLDPLAGPGAGAPTLSAEQMRRLTNGGGMSVPANSPVRMNVPASVSMRGGRSVISGFGPGGWGSGG